MKKSVRYSEIFGSFQGEATYAGMPSVWVRLFGCNLSCDGFGQDQPTKPETYVLPYKDLDVSQFKTMEELPVFPYGCDSSYSWSARYKDLVHSGTLEQVAKKIEAVAFEKFGTIGWINSNTYQKIQLCFTGGEPMLWQEEMMGILDNLVALPSRVTIETNATKKIDHVTFSKILGSAEVHFAMSPKLRSVSGEEGAVDIETIMDYVNTCTTFAIKFVHNGSDEAWAEVDDIMKRMPNYIKFSRKGSFWIMPVGATKESQQTDQVAKISDEAMRRGFNVATRNHAYVYGNVVGK